MAAPPPPRFVPHDDTEDEVVVIEEHSPPPRRHKSKSHRRRSSSARRESGFREVDPDRFAGGDAPLRDGTPDEQRRTIDRFFTPDAEFVHPFCIAPRFSEGDLVLPGLRRLSSRDALRGIFQWYRMLSPKIVIDIDTAYKMYLDMRQVFSIWFAPGYHARVRLVTVLDLVPCDLGAHRNGEPQVIARREDTDGGEKAPQQPGSTATGGRSQQVWRISRQEDLYQVNEFLKFTGPYWWCVWRPLWFLFQLFATAISVFLSLFVALSPWAFQQNPAPGGVESTVQQVETYHDDKDDEVKPDKPDGKTASHSAPASGEDSSSGSGGSGAAGRTNGNSQAANSKAHPSTPPRKSWKGGKKDGR
ncbi:hypothetical protein INS49_000667 [Diaporthe citri]|uniref:uncharacterized protein n=1 Tax=Diaporthe citri TaxID=83186 RepID=UPI001C8240DB|nr:uncharacterized protein INS49_000667 [Diaporthe citri]KAG6366490.1 hypothetical protein INS49_000667 [Diaporthe citri]